MQGCLLNCLIEVGMFERRHASTAWGWHPVTELAWCLQLVILELHTLLIIGKGFKFTSTCREEEGEQHSSTAQEEHGRHKAQHTSGEEQCT